MGETATDELRRLLDERGVRYIAVNDFGVTWYAADGAHTADESMDGTLIVTGLTPAQAVEATLGRGTCEMVVSGTDCEGNADRACSACGAYNIFSEYYDGEGHRASLRYCPNCGREVKGEP